MSQTGLEDPTLAHKYREQAAERGKTRMYFELANDYILGRGVKKDEGKLCSGPKRLSISVSLLPCITWLICMSVVLA